MSALSAIPPEQQEILIALPYKAGMAISYAEDEEGEDDDARETKALETALKLHAAPKQTGTADLIAEIVTQTLARRADWPRWSEQTFAIEPECEKAVKILKSHASETEIRAYIAMMLDVTTRVAQAYGEFGMPEEKPKGIMGFVKKIMGGPDTANQPMNVSPAEDDSITRITKALKKYA